MQIHFRKFPVILLIFLFFKIQLSFSQDVEFEIKKADSLFNLKKYTQAFGVYENLYNEKGVYTPKMLIKMAFIQEGLNNYSSTLFYLNNYYRLTNDNRVLEKMEDLAEKNQLEGYEYSDFKFFVNLYRFYKLQISFILVLIISILIAWIIYTKLRHKKTLRIAAIFTISLLVIFLGLNVFVSYYSTAIVSKKSYMMSGPSAGADVVEVMKAGNRITILDNEDIWIKIKIDDKTGYIKKNNILELQ